MNESFDRDARAAARPGEPLSGLTLRRAASGDALCLSVLAMQVFLDTYATRGIRPQLAREVLGSYSESLFTKAIADGGARLLVAEHEKHMIGFAQLTLQAIHELAPPGKQAELLRLYVQEPFTGVKVGTALLRGAEALGASAGASVLWLTPWVHNHRARAFYASQGYADHGLTYFEFESESHENRVLAKRIGTAAG